MSSKELQDALGIIMKNAQKMMDGQSSGGLQSKMAAQRAKIVQARVGNCLTVSANLAMEIESFEPDDAFYNETPQVQLDLLRLGANQALQEAKEAARQEMGDMAKMMGLNTEAVS
jgi:DNA-binding protein YbaB